jgi:prepilin-type N-terminal cleavage/methylation domain-containing protein
MARVSGAPSVRAARTPFRTQRSALRTRRAVTLVELLIVMVILAILGAAVMGMATAAMESARDKRTRSLVSKIHTLVMERYASYETRRIDLHPEIMAAINSLSGSVRGEVLADARLLGIRELMKMEMPDRWSDVLNGAVTSSGPGTQFYGTTVLAAPPSLAQTYYRRFRSLKSADPDVIQANQGAECLYLIVMNATGDGEARTMFGKQDIGDTDDDGAFEFLDGWGRPIQFIRWPAGFVGQSALMSPNADADHDPFDVYRRDSIKITLPKAQDYPPRMRPGMAVIRNRNQRAISGKTPPFLAAFRLTPLIYSAGPDGDSDLTVTPGTTTQLDPYSAHYGASNDMQLGWPYDQENDGQGWQDNVHNHNQLIPR